MIRALLIAAIFSVSMAVGASWPSFVHDAAAGPGGRINAPKTAEWEGEWVSVSSQIGYLESRGIFRKAAAATNGRAAGDIRQAFLKRFGSDIERVRIAQGRFTFLSPDGSIVIGEAQYAYAGFVEHMSEGREVQWHRFTLTGGLGKYPVLVCSEPHGVLGQWMIVHGNATSEMKNPRFDSGEDQAMMIPADLSAEVIAEALDTPEFVFFLLSLPGLQKNEGKAGP